MPVRIPSILVLVLVALLPCGTSFAQDENPNTKLFNLKFSGGTVVDYINAVAKTAGGANVFVAPEASQVPMPPMELQSVTVANALGVLHGRVHNDARRSIQLMYSEGGTFAENERPIFSITAKVSGSRDATSLHNRIWSIAMLQASEVSADDMLTAIQAALDLIGADHTPAQLRLHESTGLLIARGSVEQLETISEAIERLEQSAAVRQAAKSGGPLNNLDRAEIRKHLDEQTQVIHQLQARIQELEAQLQRERARN